MLGLFADDAEIKGQYFVVCTPEPAEGDIAQFGVAIHLNNCVGMYDFVLKMKK